MVRGFEPLEAPDADVRLFPPEGSAEGCASGECLPEAAAPASPGASAAPAPASPGASAAPAPASPGASAAPAPASPGAPTAPAPASPGAPTPAARALAGAPVASALAASASALTDPDPADEPDDAEPDDAPPAETPAARDDLSLSLTERWRQAVEVVRRASPRQGASLAFARLLWLRPGEVAVAFQPAHGFHKATVVSASSKAAIEKCFQQHFGRPTLLKVEALPAAPAGGGTTLPGPSLAEQDLEVRRRRDQETEATVRTHPAVRATLRLLGGEIEHIQMLEPEPKPVPRPVEGEPSAVEDA